MPPVVGRKIGAPDLDAFGCGIFLDDFGAAEAGNAEERRRRGAVAERCGHRRDAVLDLLLGAFERQLVHVPADGSGCGWRWCGRHRGPCARLPDWRWPGVRPGRRSPSRNGRRGCPESGCCISAAGRRRRSAPPRGLPAAAFRHIAWCRCGDVRADRPPACARCRAHRDGPGNRPPRRPARRRRSACQRPKRPTKRSMAALRAPIYASDHKTPASFQSTLVQNDRIRVFEI